MPQFVPVVDDETPRLERDGKKVQKMPVDRGWQQGTVGWGVQGNFGSHSKDDGAQEVVHRTKESDAKMIKNEKGLWVKVKGVKAETGCGRGRGGGIPVFAGKQDTQPRLGGGVIYDADDYVSTSKKRTMQQCPADRHGDVASASNRHRSSGDTAAGTPRHRSRSRSNGGHNKQFDRRHYREHSRERSRRSGDSYRDDSRKLYSRSDEMERSSSPARSRHKRNRSRSRERAQHRGHRYERRYRSGSRSRSASREEHHRGKRESPERRLYGDDDSTGAGRGESYGHRRSRIYNRSRSRDNRSDSCGSNGSRRQSTKKSSDYDGDGDSSSAGGRTGIDKPHNLPGSELGDEEDDDPTLFVFTANQIVNRFLEVFASRASAARITSIRELYHRDAVIGNMKNGAVLIAGVDAICTSFERAPPRAAAVSKRVFVEAHNSCDVSFCVDLYRAGESPGLGHQSKATALLYRCAGNTITHVYGMVDKEGLAMNKDLSAVDMLASGVWKCAMDYISRDLPINIVGAATQGTHYHNYDKMDVWG